MIVLEGGGGVHLAKGPGGRVLTKDGLSPSAPYTGLPAVPLEKDLVFSLTQQGGSGYSHLARLAYPFLPGGAFADITLGGDGGAWVYHPLEPFPAGLTVVGWLATLYGIGVGDSELDSLMFGSPPSNFLAPDLSSSLGPLSTATPGTLTRGGPADDWGAGPQATDDLNAIPDFGLFWNFSNHGGGAASVLLTRVTLRYFLAP